MDLNVLHHSLNCYTSLHGSSRLVVYWTHVKPENFLKSRNQSTICRDISQIQRQNPEDTTPKTILVSTLHSLVPTIIFQCVWWVWMVQQPWSLAKSFYGIPNKATQYKINHIATYITLNSMRINLKSVFPEGVCSQTAICPSLLS